jgi:DNA-binding NarL/FixJ family response regulator
MVKLLVVEDHALVREGLVQTLRQLETDVDILAVADSDGASALLEQGQDFDLILLDLGLPGVDGFSCLRAFRQRYPAIPVVILSAYDDAPTVNKAMKCGAASFVPKTYSSDRLLAVLREVLAGRVFPPDLVSASLAAISPHASNGKDATPSDFGLTERQAEVLGLMASGKSNRDIAGQLGLSEGTVKIHVTAIFKALGVSSRTQAMVAVARHGIRL